MFEIPRKNQINGVLRYAMIGGGASIPLSLGWYWFSGMGNHFSTLPIFFGGILAGYLAQTYSRKPARAGIVAGMIGGLPGFVWILPQMSQTASDFTTTWSSPLGAVVILGFSIPAIIAVAILPGWIGSFVGGWAAKKVG
jgi:uncharacterized membrane protein YeaQ/YmgE (transglycosylase-associated protein family)